ncbi:MAG: hypothetical protein WC712_00225, partial [Candidatus Brocadiia bacterium]
MAKGTLYAIAVLIAAFFAQPTCQASAVRVTLDSSTGSGTAAAIHLLRAASLAESEKANALIIEIDLDADSFQLADTVADELIRLQSKGILTVAFIRGKCWGAPTFIALACTRIYCSDLASISPFPSNGGDNPTPPVKPSSLIALEKAIVDAATRSGHHPALFRMFFENVAVMRVVTLSSPITAEIAGIRSYQIPGRPGFSYLLTDEQARTVLDNYRPLVTSESAFPRATPILLLGSSEMLLAGIAADVAGDAKALASLLDMDASTPILPFAAFEWVLVVLYHPLMLALLLAMGFLSLYIELHAPGTLVGAGFSLLFFGLFFWATVYVGTAGLPEIGLFILGILCLAVEVLVTPGFGVIGVAGILLTFYALFASFIPGLLPLASSSPFDSRLLGMGRAGQAALSLMGSLVFMSLAAIVLSKFLPEMPLFRRLVHSSSLQPSEIQSLPDRSSMLLGKSGFAITDLRPAGKVEIDGQVVDAQSD